MEQATRLLYIILSITISSCAQIIWKKGAKLKKISIKEVIKTVLTPTMMIGLVMYFTAALIWIIVLSNTEVSYAFPFFSIGYVIVAILSKIILKEEISMKRILGMTVIITGVILVGVSL